MTAIYVLTCRREGENVWPHVEDTLRAIDSEELDGIEKVLFCDGVYSCNQLYPFQPYDPSGRDHGWRLVEWERPPKALVGNKLPYFALLEDALERGFDDVVVLEDDVMFAGNAARRMVSFQVPSDLAWVQFFSPHVFPAPNMQVGLWRPPRGSSMFTQATKFPLRTLGKLVEWGKNPEAVKFTTSDDAVQLAAIRLGLRYGAHCPDLVQHVGSVSAASPGATLEGSRTSCCWPGPGFDVLKLYTRDDRFR